MEMMLSSSMNATHYTANCSTKVYADREKKCEMTEKTVGTVTDLTSNAWNYSFVFIINA